MYGENGTDGDIDIDIGRAVQRIDKDHILPLVGIPQDLGRLVHLFGHHIRYELAIGKGFEKGVVRDFVQFLHDFALHIDLVFAPSASVSPATRSRREMRLAASAIWDRRMENSPVAPGCCCCCMRI